MSGLFDKRKKRKLYEQWVEKSGLPEENIPDELRQDHENIEEPEFEGSQTQRTYGQRSFVIHLETRHLLILGLVIVFLLVLSSTLATVLIMQSC
jgi:hypothetical protein